MNGGLSAGITTIAGPSRHFKTSFALVMVAAFLDSDPEAICIFLDNEFGAKKSYFEQYGVDPNRVIHIPFSDIECLTFESMAQLNDLTIKDKVVFLIDSIGNAASKRELDNALAEKSALDMTRAKSLKAYFRMVTPVLNIKDIPMICINHSYRSMEMFSKDIMSGGQGIMYSSNTVWLVGKNQLKEKEDITGSKFIIKVEKSRFVREKSHFPITVRWNTGIAKWSGFEDIAEKLGIIQPAKIGKAGAYSYCGIGDRTITSLAASIDSDDAFWTTVVDETDLMERMEAAYSIGSVAAKDSLAFEMVLEDN
jgi:RecA/RadA recombinase